MILLQLFINKYPLFHHLCILKETYVTVAFFLLQVYNVVLAVLQYLNIFFTKDIIMLTELITKVVLGFFKFTAAFLGGLVISLHAIFIAGSIFPFPAGTNIWILLCHTSTCV